MTRSGLRGEPGCVPEALAEYRILDRLGAGAMGEVLLAERDGKRFALKVLHEHLFSAHGFFRRFQREAQVGSAIRHENVVGVHDCDLVLVDGRPYAFLVMDYVEGRSLREVLVAEGALPEERVRRIARDVASGLVAVHAEGVVHRDLKPENLLVAADDERVLIMDLGVARLLEATTRLTEEGQLAGSMSYASPEQLRGRDPGPASDLYTLGVVLHELLTGRNPFLRSTPAEILDAHLLEPRPDPLDALVSPFLRCVVARLLEREVSDRLASATELRRLLEEAETPSR